MNVLPVSTRLTEAAQVELTELMTRITALEAQMQALSKEAFHIQHAIRTLHSRAAHITNEALPISLLPPDVLEIVFHETRRMLVPWSGVRRPLPTEVQLSHVCRRWRAVALGTPTLWTVLRVPVLHLEHAVEAYLDRCVQCPLTVQLGPQLSGHRIVDILAFALIPRISQVRELILDTEERQELYTMLGMLANLAAPRLRRLKIMTNNPLPGQGALPPFEIFRQGAPLLSDVRLGAIPITLPPAPLSVLHFDLHPGTAIPNSQSHLLNIIRPIAPSLTVLHLKGLVSGFQDEPGSDPVVLPALRELLVYGCALMHGFNVFRHISAPSLRSLALNNVKRQALSSIHKFMARTCPEQFHDLRSLQYIDCDMDDELDIYLPHATAALRKLSVSLGCHAHLMRLLLNSDKQAVLHGTPSLWPRLRTLTIHVAVPWPQEREESESDEEDDVHPVIALLLEVVQLREAVGSRLSVLRIEGRHGRAFHDDLAPALAKAQAEVEMEVVVADTRSTELDWAGSSQFYGVQYRTHVYRRLHSGLQLHGASLR